MPVEITDQIEMEKFVRTHLAHRLTSLLSPICRPQGDPAWVSEYDGKEVATNDAYRAAKEGSYVMLRLFIEFLGVIGDRNNPGRLKDSTRESDDLRLGSFNHWGAVNLQPKDFGVDEAFVANTHRTLCKINAHFTYDVKAPDCYDRIATLDDKDWRKAAELILGKLQCEFYQKVKQPIVVHQDFKETFLKTFPAFNAEGGTLSRT